MELQSSSLYSPLQWPQIRLLRILKDESYGIPICTLSTYAERHTLVYSAVSYTWGAAEEPWARSREAKASPRTSSFFVRINEDTVKVTENLFDLIEEFRRTYKETDLYWIDALCINQADHEEKAYVVNTMDRIYSNATFVIVWLGRANSDTPRTLDFMDRILRMIEDQIARGLSLYEFVVKDIDDQERLHSLGLGGIARKDWSALVLFFNRRWFSRIWTMQEMALARTLTYRVGSHEVSWMTIDACSVWLETFSQLQQQLLIVCRAENPGIPEIGKVDLRLSVSAFQSLSHLVSKPLPLVLASFDERIQKLCGVGSIYSSVPAILFYILYECRLFGATDPRDKVYGLLGVLRKISDRWIGGQQFSLLANYQSSVADLCIDLMTHILTGSRHLSTLATVRIWKSQRILPSWVPDFAEYPRTMPIFLLHLKFDREASKRMNASRGRRSQHGFSVHGHQLHISCYTVAKIAYVGETSQEMLPGFAAGDSDFSTGCFEKSAEMILARAENSGERGVAENVRDFWNILGGYLPSVLLDYLSFAFSSYLIFLHTFEVRKALSRGSTRHSFLASCPKLQELASKDISGTIPSHDAIEAKCEELGFLDDRIIKAPTESFDQLVRDLTPFIHAIQSIFSDRRPILLESGEFGLASEDVQPGDRVCIVADGVVTPIVFRDVEGDEQGMAQLLGEVYVKELAEGEGVDRMEGEGKTWERMIVV